VIDHLVPITTASARPRETGQSAVSGALPARAAYRICQLPGRTGRPIY